MENAIKAIVIVSRVSKESIVKKKSVKVIALEMEIVIMVYVHAIRDIQENYVRLLL
jgi:hypothetical protein